MQEQSNIDHPILKMVKEWEEQKTKEFFDNVNEVYTDAENNNGYLNKLAQEIYKNNVEKGFYEEPRSFGDRIALMHSELSEALEADRKNLMDDKLPHRTGIEVELADCLIRILDCAAYLGLDIHGATMEKLAYNKTRPYKHGKKY